METKQKCRTRRRRLLAIELFKGQASPAMRYDLLPRHNLSSDMKMQLAPLWFNSYCLNTFKILFIFHYSFTPLIH